MVGPEEPNDTPQYEDVLGEPKTPAARNKTLGDAKLKFDIPDLSPFDAKSVMSSTNQLLQAFQEPSNTLTHALRDLRETNSCLSMAIRGYQEDAAKISAMSALFRRESGQFLAIAKGLSASTSLPSALSLASLGMPKDLNLSKLPVMQMLDAFAPAMGSFSKRMSLVQERIQAELRTFKDLQSSLSGSLAIHSASRGLAASARLYEPKRLASGVDQLFKQFWEANQRVNAISATGLLAAILSATTPPVSPLHAINEAAILTSEALAVVPDSPAWPKARAESPVIDSVATFSEIDAAEKATPEQIIEVINQIVDVRVQELQRRPNKAALLYFVTFLGWLFGVGLPMLQTAYYRQIDSKQPGIEQRIEDKMKAALMPLYNVGQQHQSILGDTPTVVCIAEPAANIREAPSGKTTIIGKMPTGQQAVVVGTAKGWKKLEFVHPLTGAPVTGWVSSRLLKSVMLGTMEPEN